MDSNNASWRHHYVPQFYLRQWTTGPDEALWCYERLAIGKLVEKRVVPKATGFVEDLYAIRRAFPFTTEEPSDLIETTFFKSIDNDASGALATLLAGAPLDAEKQQAWALFLCSMLHRGAHELARRDAEAPLLVEQTFSEMRTLSKSPDSAARMEDTLRSIDVTAMGLNFVRESMMRGIEKPEHLDYLKQCESRVIHAPGFPLLTTDIPLVVNFGKSERPVKLVTGALSPHHLFLLWNPNEWNFGEDEEFRDAAAHAVLVQNFLHFAGKARYLYSRDQLVDTPQMRLRTAVETRFGVARAE